MPTLLVSVQNLKEFAICRELGVGLIDFKNPAAGALEPTSAELWHQAVANNCLANHSAPPSNSIPLSSAPSSSGSRESQLSLALGELEQRLGSAADLDRLVHSIPTTGIAFAKLGWAGCSLEQGQSRWLEWAAALAPRAAPVMVAYADYHASQTPEPEALLELAAMSPCRMLLIDTYHKQQGNLFAHLPEARLRAIKSRAAALDFRLALAGSLCGSAIDQALSIGADVIAVRTAVCDHQRQGDLVAANVEQLLKQVERD